MNPHLVVVFSFCLATITIGIFIIPYYIELLIHYSIWKQIRENGLVGKAVEFMKLHEKKSGTPTMGWGIILLLVFFMVFVSIVLQKSWFTNYSLLNQKETYLSLFTLFSIGIIWAIDDYLNVKSIGKTKSSF